MGCTSSKSTAAKPVDKTPAERKVAWQSIRKELPRAKTVEDKQRRIDLFKRFDKDQSGALTLEEVYDGCISILHLDTFTNRSKDIVKRAFNKAKDMGTKDRNAGDSDKVEFLEFRLLLCYIYDYFELTVMFDQIDTSGNGIIDLKEFKASTSKIKKWGVSIDKPEAAFKEIDGNGSGQVTFDEFAVWACAKKLDADGDPDNIPTPTTTAPAAAAATAAVPKDDDAQEKRTAADRKTAWEEVQREIPREKTPEDKQRRIDLFKKFDKDGSGSLTLDEVREGCVSILHLNRFTTRVKDITKRAFNKAKDMGTKDRNEGDSDKVEFLEFRLMLCYIYDYFELTVMFDEIDTSGDMILDKKEFKEAVPKIAEWGVKVEDPDKTFDEIDDNKSGKVTFDEFAAWATAKKLDADGDPDNVK